MTVAFMTEISIGLNIKQQKQVSIVLCINDQTGKRLEAVESPWIDEASGTIDWSRTMYVLMF